MSHNGLFGAAFLSDAAPLLTRQVVRGVGIVLLVLAQPLLDTRRAGTVTIPTRGAGRDGCSDLTVAHRLGAPGVGVLHDLLAGLLHYFIPFDLCHK